MGTSILKGITTGLLVTILTLLAVLGTTLGGIEKTIISYIVDFGLLLSCLAAGYRASCHSGRILPAGLASGGYAIVGVLLLALYFPINTLGAVKIISEGAGLGLLSGILGAGILSSGSRVYDYGDDYSRRERTYHPKGDEVFGHEKTMRTEPASIKNPPSDSHEFLNHSTQLAETNADPESERTKIYEICSSKPGNLPEDNDEDVFDWWKVEAKKQLRGR